MKKWASIFAPLVVVCAGLVLPAPSAFAQEAPEWRAIEAAARSFSNETQKRAETVERQFDPSRVARAIRDRRRAASTFNWVRNHIRFEPYDGRLRGARGTLIAGAGNAVDQADLLATLLRANGFEVRFVRGKMYALDAERLLRSFAGKASLLDPKSVSSGKDIAVADASRDLRYTQLVTDHVWVEVKLRSGKWAPADPVLSESIGVAKAAPRATQADLFEDLNGTLNLELHVTLKDGQKRMLVGHKGPLHELAYDRIALTFVEDRGRKERLHGVLTAGSKTQASPESFPVAEIEQMQIRFILRQGRVETRFSEVLFDQGKSDVIFGYDQQAFDVSIFPGWTPPDAARYFGDRAVSIAAGDVRDFASAARQGRNADVSRAVNRAHRDLGFVLATSYSARLDRVARDLAHTMGVEPTFAEPRIITTGILRRGTGYDYRMNIRSGGLLAVPKMGMPAAASIGFASMLGRIAHGLEGELLAELAGEDITTVANYFDAATRQKTPLMTVHSQNLKRVTTTRFTSEQVTSIKDSVHNKGIVVLTTVKPVTLEKTPLRAWWALDPTSGQLHGSMGDSMLSTNTRPAPNDAPESIAIATLALTKRLRDSVDVSIAPSQSVQEVVCDARKDLERLSQAFCATKKAIPLPMPRTCTQANDVEVDFLQRQTCEERTQAFRCGVATSSALLKGALTTFYTNGESMVSKAKKKKPKARVQKAIGLTCR